MLQKSSAQLFLLSFLVLFFELAVIRFTAANVFYVGYFTNFVLMACLLGIGLGCMGADWKHDLHGIFPIAVAVYLGLLVLFEVEVTVPTTDQIYFQEAPKEKLTLSMWLLLPCVFVMVAGLFVSLAQPLGKLFRSLPPLEAYTWNISGSLAGIVAYTAVSFVGLPSVVWFAVSLAIFFLLNGRKTKLILWQGIAGAVCLLLTYQSDLGEVRWSPYYKVKLTPHEVDGLNIRTDISVNGVFHQLMSRPELISNMYYEHYQLFKDKRVFENAMIIGAGSGNDVSVALVHGVKHIDAVEIDPVIVDAGREFHPFQPYSSDRVDVYTTDGRAFLRAEGKKYDLIIFGLPDSLTLVSSYSSLRLENFLFTEEAFIDAKSKLTPDGVLVLYNFYREPWYIQKIELMLSRVFEQKPLVKVLDKEGHLPAVLVTGAGAKDVSREGWESPYPLDKTLITANDDWPFGYLKRPTIPSQYFMMLGILIPIVLGAVYFCWPRAQGKRRVVGHFFFMGAGFFLLEAKSIVQFALLFGSTWLVNSLVFFAILTSVLLANLIVSKFKFKNLWPICALLVVSIAMNFFVPLKALLFDDVVLRYVVASAFIFSPIFFANLLFSSFFKDTEEAGLGIASNLLGTLVGGVVEYASLLVGFRHLMLFVGLFYALVFWRAPWSKSSTQAGTTSTETPS